METGGPCGFAPSSLSDPHFPPGVSFRCLPRSVTETEWLHTPRMANPTVPEARSPNARCGRSCAPSGGSRENASRPFQLLVAPPRLVAASLQPWPHGLLPSGSPCHRRTVVTGLGPTWIIQDEVISRSLTQCHRLVPSSKRGHSHRYRG